MGEVYQATDLKLRRDVAIKFLTQSITNDGERLALLQREARVLASLNHPNIAAIHGFEESGGRHFLVMELAAGETLADQIMRGPIPVDEAMSIAKQIVRALEAAHEKGVVHRDLKPANIKVTSNGEVKVLDFGLAKVFEPADGSNPSLSSAPTRNDTETQQGVILGTPAYMSPEQARGNAADKRTDIFSFGVLLYEMLTGRKPFAGKSVTESMAAVLMKDPDWGALPPDCGPRLHDLLRRCLVKDSQNRMRDIGEARIALESAETFPVLPQRAARSIRRAIPALLALIVAIAVLAFSFSPFRQPASQGPFSFSILPPEGTSFVPISQAGPPALSPNERRIAYVTAGPGGQLLWVQSIGKFDARPLPGTEGATFPFWSPNSDSLAFASQGKLKVIDLAGGQPRALADAPRVVGGSWSKEDKILFSGGNTLRIVPLAGGASEQATERDNSILDENHQFPFFLPDGRHYLVLVRAGAELQWHVSVGELGSNQRKVLLTGISNAQFAPAHSGGSAHLLFVRDGKLLAQAFDPDRIALSGDAFSLAEDMATRAGPTGDFSVSAGGVLAYRTSDSAKSELMWYDRSGKQVGSFGERAGNARNNLRVSPDGRWAAFTREGELSQDVWIEDLVRGSASRLTFNGGRSPVWSPDSSQIAFLHDDTIYRKSAFGGGPEVPLWKGPGLLSVNDWSGDGRYLLLTIWDATKGLHGRGLWLLPDPLKDDLNHEPILLETPALHGQFGPPSGAPRWVSYDTTPVSPKAISRRVAVEQGWRGVVLREPHVSHGRRC